MTAPSNKERVHEDWELAQIEDELEGLRKKAYANLSPWQTVQVARHDERPTLDDYAQGIFTDFIELHGDRCIADDHAVMGGFATLGKKRVMVIGHRKGKTVEEKVDRNFGMANPDGYRKALRLMKLAEKYDLPVVSFIDTPGAYPGLDAEARGQAEAIARNLMEMAALEVPIVVVVTGEGGSGGALGIGVGDVVLMLSHSVYSVISPEGCAAILWHDGGKAPEAAKALRLTAEDLLKFKIIDEIIKEPPGGAHRAQAETLEVVAEALSRHLTRLARVSKRKLVESRMEKYFKMGAAEARRART